MSERVSPIRLLVADDDAILREIAGATLRAAGFAVQTVASGDAAVAACALGLPDMVLLDVEMPDGDGYQACANIRALPGGADLPIVMVTGCDDTRSIDRAYEAGATDFVVKPINWTLLEHRIRYVLRGARTILDLRFSEQKNTALLQAIPDGIFLVNGSGAIEHCFSPAAGLRGAPRTAVRVARIFSISCPRHRARAPWIAWRPRCAAKRRYSSSPSRAIFGRAVISNAVICPMPRARF